MVITTLYTSRVKCPAHAIINMHHWRSRKDVKWHKIGENSDKISLYDFSYFDYWRQDMLTGDIFTTKYMYTKLKVTGCTTKRVLTVSFRPVERYMVVNPVKWVSWTTVWYNGVEVIILWSMEQHAELGVTRVTYCNTQLKKQFRY